MAKDSPYTRRKALNAAKKERAARDWCMEEARNPSHDWQNFKAVDWVRSARFHQMWLLRFLLDARQFACTHQWTPAGECDGVEQLKCRLCQFKSWRGVAGWRKESHEAPARGRGTPVVIAREIAAHV